MFKNPLRLVTWLYKTYQRTKGSRFCVPYFLKTILPLFAGKFSQFLEVYKIFSRNLASFTAKNASKLSLGGVVA